MGVCFVALSRPFLPFSLNVRARSHMRMHYYALTHAFFTDVPCSPFRVPVRLGVLCRVCGGRASPAPAIHAKLLRFMLFASIVHFLHFVAAPFFFTCIIVFW